jgi:CRP-like cAMP-binding protein
MTAEPWSMTLADVSSALGSVPLFSAFSKRQLRMIAESGREYRYKSGYRLVEEGTSGDRFYLILEGKVEIRKGGRVLATLSKGQFFGELSLIDEQPWAADVVAVQPTHCLALSERIFSTLTRRHPELLRIVLKEVVGRLRVAEGHLVS